MDSCYEKKKIYVHSYSVGLGFNDSLASYIALALSPHLASHGLQQDTRMRQELELDYRRLMEGRTIQDVFEKAALKYYSKSLLTSL